MAFAAGDVLAVEQDRPGVELVHAADRLDQGRLAGAVVAEQGEHLAGVDVERHAVERDDRVEPLAGIPHLQDRGRRRASRRRSTACRLRNRLSSRPRMTSSSTATTMTAPVAMYCQFGSMPSRLSPLRITAMISAPVRALRTVPRPPRKLAPPMITAAMASSSASAPDVR